MMTDLKILRKMTDLTQYELARESGVPRWKGKPNRSPASGA